MTTAKQVYEWVKTGHWNLKQFLEWAQPAQEPVACIYKGYLYMAHEFQSGQVPVDSQPLYTHTPQRPWVGIPGEDLKQGDESFYVAWREGARWAEAYLMEKNSLQ